MKCSTEIKGRPLLKKLFVEGHNLKEEFIQIHKKELKRIEREIGGAVKKEFTRLRRKTSNLVNHDKTTLAVLAETEEYVRWLEWTLLDLRYIIIGLGLNSKEMSTIIGKTHLAVQAVRIFDDIIDNHETYKDSHPTLLARLRYQTRQEKVKKVLAPEGLALLSGLLFLCHAIQSMADEPGLGYKRLCILLDSFQRTLTGLIYEFSPVVEQENDYIHRLFQLKAVSYAMMLFETVLIPSCSKRSTKDFLSVYKDLHELGQMANDAYDIEEDRLAGQPNIFRVPNKATRAVRNQIVESVVTEKVMHIWRKMGRLPKELYIIAWIKLTDVLNYLRQGGFLSL